MQATPAFAESQPEQEQEPKPITPVKAPPRPREPAVPTRLLDEKDSISLQTGALMPNLTSTVVSTAGKKSALDEIAEKGIDLVLSERNATHLFTAFAACAFFFIGFTGLIISYASGCFEVEKEKMIHQRITDPGQGN